ncbi:MAG: ABC transporter ATP-binding protein, partial [Nocardioidaceae bacterium]
MTQTSEHSVRPVAASLRGFGWRPVSRRRPVIEGLDLDVEPGQRLLLAGPSGAGKSTVLAALAGSLGSTVAGDVSGRVEVGGRVGLLLQNPHDSVVAERIGRDVAFGMENAGTPAALMWPRIHRELEAVRLAYPVTHPTSALSGGETQRLALAGVLALRPGLLLLDEPTSMLDATTARSVRAAILDAVERTGATLV